MQEHLIGGQIVHPVVGEVGGDPARKAALLALVAEIDAPGHRLALSIDLGGMLVVAGDEASLAAFQARRASAGDASRCGSPIYRLPHRSRPRSPSSVATYRRRCSNSQKLPMVDGRGRLVAGRHRRRGAVGYTLSHQVTETYGFTRAVEVAARRCPDLFVVTGPGDARRRAVAQSLILADWAE